MKKTSGSRRYKDFKYDVTLSFAGEDRAYVERVAHALHHAGIRVFYDQYNQIGMWGKNLYTHLQDIYQNAARFCVLFISRRFARSVWTNHERESAQARAISQHSEYILPVRFDRTKVPGLLPTIGYIDLSNTPPTKLAKLIIRKIGPLERADYMPPIPNLLHKHLHIRAKRDSDLITHQSHRFFDALQRLSKSERRVVFHFILNARFDGLPDEVDIDLDILRRSSRLSRREIIEALLSIRSLGFRYRLQDENPGDYDQPPLERLFLEWHDLDTPEDIESNATDLAVAMIELATDGFCTECGFRRLMRLDFSQLSSATTTTHSH